MTEGDIDQVAAFFAAWTVILFIMLSIAGTASMRRVSNLLEYILVHADCCLLLVASFSLVSPLAYSLVW
jgi:hypothetical protein